MRADLPLTPLTPHFSLSGTLIKPAQLLIHFSSSSVLANERELLLRPFAVTAGGRPLEHFPMLFALQTTEYNRVLACMLQYAVPYENLLCYTYSIYGSN